MTTFEFDFGYRGDRAVYDSIFDFQRLEAIHSGRQRRRDMRFFMLDRSAGE